jgi:DNA-binding GntR family transcriptional regulator
VTLLSKIESAPPLRDQVASQLRTSIINGTLGPGTRLVERELCAQMGVSRPSVREALRQLESEGLITNLPNRGPTVAIVTEKTAAEIYQVRSAIEGLAARLFARNASDDARAEIRQCCNELLRMPKSASALEYLALKDKFYSILLAGAGNEMLAHFAGVALRRFYQIRNLSVARTDRAEESRREIKDLVDALIARDEEAAARSCVAHIENTATAVLKALKAQNRSTGG